MCGVGLAGYSAPFQRGRWRWGSWQRTGRLWSDRREAGRKGHSTRTWQRGENANANVTALEKCGSMCELCTVMCAREKCASARVQVGVVCTPPVALTTVATGWVRNSDSSTSVEKKLEQDCSQTYRLPVDGDNVELVVLGRVAPVSWMLFRLLWESEFDVGSLTIVLSICHLATCVGAISANFESMKTNSIMFGLGDQLEDNGGSDYCGSANRSAQFVLNHSRYSCSEGPILFCKRFLSLTWIQGTCSYLFDFSRFDNPFFAPGTLVVAIEVNTS